MKLKVKIFITIAIIMIVVSGTLWFVLNSIFESEVKTQKKKKAKPIIEEPEPEIEETQMNTEDLKVS